MRGKEVLTKSKKGCIRITPAYAGKSGTQGRALHGRRDHPRVCGEKVFFPIHQYTAFGSPPRMRGKAVLTFDNVLPVRITPAYAGKSYEKTGAGGG